MAGPMGAAALVSDPAGLLTVGLVGASVGLALWRPGGRLRPGSQRPPAAGRGDPSTSGSRRQGPAGARAGTPNRALLTPRSASVVAGAAAFLLVGGVAGAALALVVAVGLPGPLSRLEPAAVAARRRQLAGDLPLALDLLAGCLAGGGSPGAAASAVGRAVGGPCGDRLLGVAGAISVGTPGEDAWARLAGSGGVTSMDPLAAAARALSRAAEGGAPVAATMARLAGEARAAARLRGQAAARKAGVVAVAPLGLCFLPAFMLLGVVPAVAGLAGPVLAQF